MPPKSIILGIDPGVADTGWGVIAHGGNQVTLVAAGCITTSKKICHADRLNLIYQKIKRVIRTYSPTVVAVEKLFFSRNVKTALSVGEARGIIMLACAQAKLHPLEPSPQAVKQSLTTYGQADKKQVEQMVKTILKLKKISYSDDTVDALAIAIWAINQ